MSTLAVPAPPKKPVRTLNSRSASSGAADEDKENKTESFATPSLPALAIKSNSVANHSEAQKAAGLGSSSQIPHTSLEVDEMGLFTLKPRAADISSIDPKAIEPKVKVTRAFCEPAVRSSANARAEKSSSAAATT